MILAAPVDGIQFNNRVSVSEITQCLDKKLKELALIAVQGAALSSQRQQKESVDSIEDRLRNANALCKTKTASIAMHVSKEWLFLFYRQLDSLMDPENWEDDDTPITDESFATLLRMLLYVKPEKRPGLGATSTGNIIATWTKDKERLTIECLPSDKVRWVLSVYINNERESAAGVTSLKRLLDVLSPYVPQHWFENDY
jgi:hypothetical protein